MPDQNITITFTGSSASLVQAAGQVQQALQGVQSNAKQMGAATQAGATAAGMAMVELGKKALSMAKDAVGSFSSIASEVRKMKGIIGGSAEEMSRLRFAGEEVGVSADTITRSYRLLSTHMVANDKYAQMLGVSYKNLDGSLRAPTDVLGEVADKLNAMPAGMERTTMGAKLFGRGFAEINPLLRQGAEGMKEFAKESDILGLTMSEKDLAAAKQLTMANRLLHAVMKGVFVEIGRVVVPILATIAESLSKTAVKIRDFINHSDVLKTTLKVLGGIILGVASAVAIYKTYMMAARIATVVMAAAQTAWTAVQIIAMGVTEGFTGIMAAFNLVMNANPIGLVVVAIIALIGVIIFLVKKFEPVGDVVVWFFKLFGNIGGKAIGIAVTALKWLGIGVINIVRIIGKAGEAVTGNRFFKAIFGDGANKSIKGALKSLDGFQKKFEEVADNIASTAWNKGGEFGEKLGKGAVNAIKNLKLPSFKMKDTKGGDDVFNPDFNPDDPTGKDKTKDKKEEVKTDLQQRLDAVKEYWSERVKAAKEAYDEAKSVADQAKADMANIASSVAQSITSGFDINAITQSSYAKYLGADYLIAAFRKKLTDAQEFVGALRSLRSQGLPVEMLQQIAAAGVDGGLDTARLLVGNAGAISQLQGIQAELTSAATAAGATVSEAVMGQTVLTTSAAQTTARTNLTAEQEAARLSGATVTETANTRGDINVQVDVRTDADPQYIGTSVAWAIATQTPARAA
jgi:hypothetical protein